MAADFDAPRNAAGAGAGAGAGADDNVVTIDARATTPTELAVDLDDGDSADGFKFLASIVDEALDVVVLPMQENEYVCVECFLVRPQIQLAHETSSDPCASSALPSSPRASASVAS